MDKLLKMVESAHIGVNDKLISMIFKKKEPVAEVVNENGQSDETTGEQSINLVLLI